MTDRSVAQTPGGVSVLEDTRANVLPLPGAQAVGVTRAEGLLRILLMALTPTMLCLAPICAPFLSLHHRFFYHQDGSALPILLALLANIGAAWFGFALLFWIAERHQLFQAAVWSVFALLCPWLLLRDYCALMYTTLPPALIRGTRLAAVLLLLLEVLLWRRYVRPRFPRILRALQTLTLLSSAGWLITVAQLCVYVVSARALNDPRPGHLHATVSVPAAAKAGPPVVWIVLDELGQDPVFTHRLAGLHLPAFDALANESTMFSQAVAPGLYTEQVVPALLTGSPVRFVSFSASGELFFREAPTDRWRSIDPMDTIFADALRNGYTTDVVGWHNPYCRLFAATLDHCFSSSRASSVTPEFDSQKSFSWNLLGPIRHMLRNVRAVNPYRTADAQEAGAHIQDLQLLTAHSDAEIQAGKADFLFIHLPIPHPSGIYSRARSAFDTSGTTSYVDNLALADRVLAHLKDELRADGRWDRSAVIVMGDHSWRTLQQWKPTRSWTQEDQVASQGGYDARPAYLLKLPGQHTGSEISEPFATLRTRSLLDAIMGGKVHTPADVAGWAAARH